jgi:DNA-binding GntR family transcriptional regulator
MSTRSSIRTELHRAILEQIVRGKLIPGDRIKESHLARSLGASRTPLREALFSLERDGFVRSELDRGFSVEPLSGREVRETYPILWTLEGLAVRSGVPLAYSLVDKLAQINSRLAGTVGPGRALELDTQWHETLVSASPNRRLKETLARLRLVIRRYELVYMKKSPLIFESVRQHQEVIDALVSEDLDAAVEGLTENWRFGMEALLVHLGEP